MLLKSNLYSMDNTRRRREALGAQVSVLRHRLGMSTQQELARAAGIGVRAVSEVETGKGNPRTSTLRKIEVALRLVPGATDDFLDGKVRFLVPEEPAEEDPNITAIRAATTLPPELRDSLERLYRDRNKGNAEGTQWYTG